MTGQQLRATIGRAVDFLHPTRAVDRLPEPHATRAALTALARRRRDHAPALHRLAAVVGDHLTPTTAARLRDGLAHALTLTDA